MASEATVQASLAVKKGNLDYQSRPTTFRADVAVAGGPSPGLINVSVSGTDIDLSKLSHPGLYQIHNLDETNYVTFGIYEPTTDFFYPVHDILPGEAYVNRFARAAGMESTGTGTLVGYNSTFQLRANTATCKVVVEAFES